MTTLVQKFKNLIDDKNNSDFYDTLFVKKHAIYNGNLSLYTTLNDTLLLDLEYRGSITLIEFYHNYMSVEVSRNYELDSIEIEHSFDLEYDASKEILFQLNTMYDLGFIEHRFMKYLKQLNEIYSLSYEENN